MQSGAMYFVILRMNCVMQMKALITTSITQFCKPLETQMIGNENETFESHFPPLASHFEPVGKDNDTTTLVAFGLVEHLVLVREPTNHHMNM